MTNDVSVVGRMTWWRVPRIVWRTRMEDERFGSVGSVGGFRGAGHLGRAQPPTLGPPELHSPLFLLCSPALSLRHSVLGFGARTSLEHFPFERHQSVVYPKFERCFCNADSTRAFDMTDMRSNIRSLAAPKDLHCQPGIRKYVADLPHGKSWHEAVRLMLD